MLALLSDAYMITPDHCMALTPERLGVPPDVTLDGSYKFVDRLMELVANGANVPSLVKCTSLAIEGDIVFDSGVIIQGRVKVINTSNVCKTLQITPPPTTSILFL